MRFAGLILDFDGVLIESEAVGNRHIAAYLTDIGHPTTAEESMARFMGLSGRAFIAAVEDWIGQPLPDDFHDVRKAEDARVLTQGLDAVAGAVAFVEDLPLDLPKAIASSSSVEWIKCHLRHLRLDRHFEGRMFSGRTDVARGKPAPDLYLHAAMSMAVPIDRIAIIEDSPVGVTGAVASGAFVIGLTAASHCPPGHGDRLRALGAHALAADFDEVRALLA